MKPSATVKWLLFYCLLPVSFAAAVLFAYVRLIDPLPPHWQVDVKNEGDKDCFIAMDACQFIEEVRVPAHSTVTYKWGTEEHTGIDVVHVGRSPSELLKYGDFQNQVNVYLELGNTYTLVVNDQGKVWFDTGDVTGNDTVLREYDPPVKKKNMGTTAQ